MIMIIDGMYSDKADVVSSPDAINGPCALRKATKPSNISENKLTQKGRGNYFWLVHGLRQQMHWAKFIANCPNRELLQEMVIRTAKWVIWIAYKGARSLNLKQAHLGIYFGFII